ncbi:unnamed protein product [Sphenostylis stenocarpa]|uniref:Uncharacterized protein n=1 Tax=Sphenostylis stenocarpa TaxID=92480 RepID=A0AA86T2K5_9FABA|nr:unnamed protein product [Sphenostylis stenocarpa]
MTYIHHTFFLAFMLVASLLVPNSFATSSEGDYGALTRVTCEAVDEHGFETTPFSFLSVETDSKGYFLATLNPREVAEKHVLKECRAFLDASPLNNCTYATDVNKGTSGALLHSPRFLHDKKMKLYTVGPFLFTSSPTPISDGY